MPKRKRKEVKKVARGEKIHEVQSDDDEQPPSKKFRRNPRTQVTTPDVSTSEVATIESHKVDITTTNSTTPGSRHKKISRIHLKDLVVHVPKGQWSDLFLKLNIDSSSLSISTSADFENARPPLAQGNVVAQKFATLTAPVLSRSRNEEKSGFLKLPAELRDMIYSEVFISKLGRGFDPSRPDSSAIHVAFLRTCRQVYNEGRKWLYSENKFYIGRDWRSRGGFWQSKWPYLGYETCNAFLKIIGDANLALLRDISLHLYDGTPTGMPNSRPEDRRYIYDEHLISIVSLLAKKTHLHKIKVVVDGRKRIESRECEIPFLDRLCQIEADHVEITGLGDSEPTKMDSATLAWLRVAMKRRGLEDSDDDDESLFEPAGSDC